MPEKQSADPGSGGAAVPYRGASGHRTNSANAAWLHQDRRPDFRDINSVALAYLPALLARWLPDGRTEGNEYVARNPRRHDRHPGSFKVNLIRGAWADFATGDRGGDVISLAAFLAGTSQGVAARELARMLDLEPRR
jgi:hypothetical protein